MSKHHVFKDKRLVSLIKRMTNTLNKPYIPKMN